MKCTIFKGKKEDCPQFNQMNDIGPTFQGKHTEVLIRRIRKCEYSTDFKDAPYIECEKIFCVPQTEKLPSQETEICKDLNKTVV